MRKLKPRLAAVFIFVQLIVALRVAAQGTSATKAYPDFAMQAPPINASPGPEYASSTRMFQGIASIERAPGGRLWAAWEGGGSGEGPYNYVVLTTSADDGRTWSEAKLVIDPRRFQAAVPGLWLDPLGRLWLFWRQAYGGWDGRGGVWTMTTEDPNNENPSWSQPRRLADGHALNKPIVLSTGEWILPVGMASVECGLPRENEEFKLGLAQSVIKFMCHDPGDERGSNVYRSLDEGKTWSWLGQARVPDTGFDEHMVVERRDGSLWMLVRTLYGMGQSISTDGGKTWTQSGPSGIRNVPARFHIRRLKSGALLLVKNNPPSIAVRSHLTAYVSDDEGKSWAGGLLLDERRGVAYPDGTEGPNGKIYVIYDHGRETDREILMATFTEQDIREGKCVSNGCQLKSMVNKGGEDMPQGKGR